MRRLFDPTAIWTQELIRPLTVSTAILVLIALIAVPGQSALAANPYPCGMATACNDPENVKIRVRDAEVTEGPGATLDFEVRLSHAHSSATVTMDYEIRDSTEAYAAVAGEDYTDASGTLSFLPGETTKTISIAVLDDAVSEGVESIELRLSNASKATFVRFGAAQPWWSARGTIIPDDATAPAVAVRADVGVTAPVSGHFGISVTFSEPVQGFGLSDLRVTNGSVTKFRPHRSYVKIGSDWWSTLVDSSRVWFATIVPDDGLNGNVSIQVPAGAATNRSGTTDSTASNTLVMAVRGASPMGKIPHLDCTAPNVRQSAKHRPANVRMRAGFGYGHMRLPGFGSDDIAITTMDGQNAGRLGILACQGGAGGGAVDSCEYIAWTKEGLSGTFVVRILAGAITDEMGRISRASRPLYVAGDNWTVSVSDASATEGTDDTIDFEVSLNGRDDCREVSVDWATVDGTAIAGEDYTGASGTLTFAPGETSKTVSVAVLDDTVSDSGETFTLRLSNAVGNKVELGSAEATGTILNDEENETGTLPVVSIAESATPVMEGTAAAYTLSRTGATDTALAVTVSVTETGSVLDGTPATSVTIEAGSDSATLSVATEDDEVTEDASTLTATVSSGTGYAVDETSGSAEVVVEDDDAAPVVTTGSPIEVAENATAVATLAATDADTAAGDLAWSIPEGEAGGADASKFSLTTAGVLTFKAAKDFESPDDTGSDGDYEVTVRVTDGSNPVDAALVVRLTDVEDTGPTASFESLPERHDGSAAFRFELHFSEAPSGLSYRTVGGGLLEVTGGTVTHARRLTRGSNQGWEVTIEPTQEGDIVITLPARAFGPTNAICMDGEPLARAATATIPGPASPSLPVVSIAESATPVMEGTAAAFTLTRTGATGAGLTVTVSVTEIGSVLDGTPATSVTIEAGSDSATLSVATEDDEVSEDASTLRTTVTSGTGYTVDGTSGSADVVVNDDDAAPVMTTASPIEVAENGTAVATLAATDADTNSENLSWSIPEGAAGGGDGSKFSLTTAGVLTFRAAKDYEAPDDANTDGDYEVKVRVTDGSNPVDAELVVRLTDMDEVAPRLSRATVDGDALKLAFNEALDEGSTPSASSFAVTVAGSARTVGSVAVSESAVTLTLSSAVVSGEAVTVGYTVPTGVDTQPVKDTAGNAAATFASTQVTNETVGIPVVSIAAPTTSVTEGTALAFILSRTGSTDGALTVAVSVTENGGVLEDTPPSSVSLASGSATATLSVATVDDDVFENASTVTVTAGTGYTVDTDAGLASGVVESEDLEPITASFTRSASEHDGSNGFELHLEFSHEPAGFSYRTVQGALLDIAGGRITRVWRLESGKNHKWGIVVTPDGVDAVTLAARATTDCTATHAVCTADGRKLAGTLRLTVPGPQTLPVVSIAASTTPVTEGTAAAFTLTRTGATDAALAVTVSVTETGSVLDGTPATSVTIEAGSDSATLSVATEDDEVSEDASTLMATVTSGTGYTVDGTSGSADVVVNDDDAAPVMTTASPIEVAENGTAVATLAATDADTNSENLSWSIPEGAAGGADASKFALTAAGVLTFRAVKDFEAPDDANTDGDYEVTVRVTDGSNPVDAALVVRLTDMDEVAPRLSRATVDGDALKLAFNEALDEGSTPPASSFAVTVAGSARTVDSVSVSESAVTLTLSSAVVSGETVMVGYTVPTGADAQPVKDPAGNPAARFANSQVTNETAGLPVVSVSASTTPVTEGTAAAFTLTRTGATDAALAVTVSVTEIGSVLDGTPATSVTIEAGSDSATLSMATEDDEVSEDASTLTATVLSGTGYTVDGTSGSADVVVNDDDAAPVVTTASPIAVAENETAVATLAATDADTAAGDLSWSIPEGEDGGADAAKFSLTAEGALSFQAAKDFEAPDDANTDGEYEVTVRVTDGANSVDAALVVRLTDVDEVAPTLSRASVDGDALKLTFNEALDEGSAPPASSFAVTVAGSARAVGSVAVSGSAVTLTLSSAVVSGETVTVGYTVPTGADTQPVKDTAGNAAATFASTQVTNETVGLPLVSIAAASTAVTEGAAAAFTLTRTGATDAALTVAVSVSQAGSMMSGAAPTEAVFAANAAQARISVSTDDDDEDEPDAQITASIAATSAFNVEEGARSARVDVYDNDEPGPASVEIWSSTLTWTDYGNGWLIANAEDFSDPDWSENGRDYQIWYIAYGPSTREFWVAHNGAGGDISEPGQLALHVGGVTIDSDDVMSAFGQDQIGIARGIEQDWAVGDKVSVRLTRTVEVETAPSGPGLSVADARVNESAGVPLRFRVMLAERSDSVVSVRYRTSDGTIPTTATTGFCSA